MAPADPAEQLTHSEWEAFLRHLERVMAGTYTVTTSGIALVGGHPMFHTVTTGPYPFSGKLLPVFN
jgi:hypothetical protein